MRFSKIKALILTGAVIGTVILSGCGKTDNDAVVATLNGDIEITFGYVNFMAHYTQSSYDSYFASYYEGEDYWTDMSFADSAGSTLEDTVKDNVMDQIELQYILETHMDEYGVEITDDEKESMAAAAEDFMTNNTEEAIKAMGGTEEYAEQILYYCTVQQKMEDAIKATADMDVSDDEAAQRTFSYIEVDAGGTYTDDDGNTVEYTDEELTSIRATAEKAADMAQTDFDSAAEVYGYDITTYSYGDDEESEEDGGFCDAVIEAAEAMSEGDVSGLIEGTDVYYIIRLDSEFDEEATQDKKDEIISERQEDVYNAVLDGYYEDVEFELDEEVWAQVKFDDATFTVLE